MRISDWSSDVCSSDLLLVGPQTAELQLEVDQPQADAEEEAGEEIVGAQGVLQHLVDILGVGPAEGSDVLLGDHRVAELVVLVVVLDDGARQRRAFLEAEALRQRSEEHTSELQSLMRISYAVFCLKKKTKQRNNN